MFYAQSTITVISGHSWWGKAHCWKWRMAVTWVHVWNNGCDMSTCMKWWLLHEYMNAIMAVTWVNVQNNGWHIYEIMAVTWVHVWNNGCDMGTYMKSGNCVVGLYLFTGMVYISESAECLLFLLHNCSRCWPGVLHISQRTPCNVQSYCWVSCRIWSLQIFQSYKVIESTHRQHTNNNKDLSVWGCTSGGVLCNLLACQESYHRRLRSLLLWCLTSFKR